MSSAANTASLLRSCRPTRRQRSGCTLESSAAVWIQMKLGYCLFRKRSGIFSFYVVDERCHAVVQNRAVTLIKTRYP